MNKPENTTIHQDSFSEGQKQDFSKYIRLFVNRWYVFVAGILVALAAAFLINFMAHPVYKGSTTLLVRSDNKNPLGSEALLPGLSFDMRENIKNDIGILKSYTLTQKTIESLQMEVSYHAIPRCFGIWRIPFRSRNIYREAPIVVNSQDGQEQLKDVPFYVRILSPTQYQLELKTEVENATIARTDTFRFGQLVKGPWFAFTVELRDKFTAAIDNRQSSLYSKDYSFTFHDPRKLASQYRKAMNVDLFFNDATILEITFEGPHPGITIDFLNQHTTSLIEDRLNEKNQMANATIEFIDRQIEGISDSLREAESEFEQFRSKNRLINISSEGEMAMEKMEELISQKSELQRKSRYYEYLYDYIRNQDEFDNVIVPSTMGINDPSLNDLVSRLTEAYSSRNRLLMTARENSPQVQQLQQEIESIREALVKNVRNIVRATEIEIEELNKQIKEVNQQVGKLPGTERAYINIQRDFQLNDNLYTFLLRKRSEAAIALASNSPDHKIIDPALQRTTYQASPRSGANYIIAGFLGLMIPALALIIGGNLNTRIRQGFDPEQYTDLPVLGNLEHSRYDEKLPVISHPNSPLTESFRALRTHIDFMLGSGGYPAVMGVSSSISGEGKSFCSANLGAVLAMTRKKVLVVGMDMRKPRTHLEFKIPNKKGLSNYLIGQNTFQEIQILSELPDLYIIPAGPVPPNPAELLQSDQMNDFLNEARKAFDIVILDMPPMALVTDALLVTRRTDLNLFVLRQRYSRKQAIQYIHRIYHSGRAGKTGLVINDVKISGPYAETSGYGYAYSRYRKSGYYEDY